jgi:hypothetical protein
MTARRSIHCFKVKSVRGHDKLRKRKVGFSVVVAIGIAALFAPALCLAQVYTITTVAGGGAFSAGEGDGGPATGAYLHDFSGVAVDSNGNLYITDGYLVRKVSPNGIISTFAGDATRAGVGGFFGDGGPATSALLSSTSGLAADSAGSVYIADSNNGLIRKVSSDGIITTIAGNPATVGDPFRGYSGDGGPATSATLNNPVTIAVDSTGNLYIAATTGFGRSRLMASFPLWLAEAPSPRGSVTEGSRPAQYSPRRTV